jgi:dTDP-3-amino-3,4,6-trideoxy-alpha-D-glucose transaminase
LPSRLDELQAAVLRVKLGHLDRWTELRNLHGQRYAVLLTGIVETPLVADWATPAWQLYPIRAEGRDALHECFGTRT